MENERLRITLDKADRIYYAGETIKGVICFNLTKRTKIRAIKVQITGKGKCKWMEILRKTAKFTNESARSLFYSSKEIYCHCENCLMVFEPRGIELNIGEHKFDFTVPLKYILPSSFKGSYGSIKYKLRILIQRPWTFDERHKIPITIIKSFVLPASSINLRHPVRIEITKTISIFGSQPITLVAILPKYYALSGSTLRICVTVTNNSTTNIEKLRFTVLQHIQYYSHVPLRIDKKECVSLATKETGGVQKKSERKFAHDLLIPGTAQPTDNENSAIIHISYELRVEAVLRGLFKNIVVNMPFTLYSADPFNWNNSIVNNPNNRVGAIHDTSSPFDTSSLGMPVYPSLNSSIGSPSYSQSESGSLYSSTSDSSATTLSPATAGAGEFSYRSSGSSNFNNTSVDDNIIYMLAGDMPTPRAESPQDRLEVFLAEHVNALNTGEPELPQDRSEVFLAEHVTQEMDGLILNATEAAPPTFTSVFNNSRPTSSAFFLNQHGPSGVDELPPSYAELFGTAPKL